MKIGKLEIADVLHTFVNEQVIPGTSVSPEDFWASLEKIVAEQLGVTDELGCTRSPATGYRSIFGWVEQE